MKLLIDIETNACSDQNRIDYLTAHLKPPANYKSDEAIAKWKLTAVDKMVDNTSFDGSAGSICTISYALGEGDIKTLQRDDFITEKSIIQSFFDELNIACNYNHLSCNHGPFTWIAHNAAFDLPFLFKRVVILGIETHGIKIPHNDRHGNGKVFCTMTEWMGYGAKAGGSLDNICNALGIEGKGDFDGSMVNQAFLDGEYKKIAEYCADDVGMLRAIYNRMTNV